MKILIAVPVYNERKYVGSVLTKIRRYAGDNLLVIDDGSTDGTGDYLAGRDDIYLLRHPENRGYGQSLIDAFKFADERGYDWIITMDCDEQHEPEMIPKFIDEIRKDDADIISGSRYLQSRSDDDLPPGDRRAINMKLTNIINDLFAWNLTDTFCGFKAHRVSAMRKLKLDIPGYAFPMQLWPQVFKAGLRVREIPVRLIYNDPTRHFGGQLDDADNRLKHYLSVLRTEMESPVAIKSDACDEVSCCSR